MPTRGTADASPTSASQAAGSIALRPFRMVSFMSEREVRIECNGLADGHARPERQRHYQCRVAGLTSLRAAEMETPMEVPP